ncbi:MAG: polymer-forming cytoskeletal protein [Acidobacteriota bacterium]|nr:polymer-forming cytoskeletal protein [Acidobacteriota bacterium]
MIYTATFKNPSVFQLPLRQLLAGLFCCAFIFTISICAQQQQPGISLADENTLVVEDAKDMEIYSFGKKVIVRKEAKGVLAFGGDVIIEGRVEGDVATIGGSIYQKEGAYIGGDVITFGGAYKHDSAQPLRDAEKETIVFAGYEDELREMMQNPTQIFAPQMSWSFLAQRLLSALFWFIVSLGLTTIAPGAVSRAVARFQLSTAKIIGLGVLAGIVSTIGVITGLKFLPSYVGTISGLMVFVILILAYVFGRVSLQMSAGKWLQKLILPEKRHSESVALLFGVLIFTILLSLPYVWALTVFVLWTASLGLVLTARSTNNWQKI